MKTFILSLFTLLFLSSCSTDELINQNVENVNAKMLESFEIYRNADGSYALTHEVSEGVNVDYSNDKTQNEVYFYSDVTTKNTTSSQNYTIENNQLNIVFKDENNSKLPNLSIVDDNTSEKNNNLSLLNTYSILYNQDGTIQVDFEVEKGVAVTFGYNTTEKINDIYLSEGNATQRNYSKNYEKDPNGNIRVDFVQTSTKSNTIKKPRVIYDGVD